MTISNYTNNLIEAISEVAGEQALTIVVNDDGEDHVCTTREQIAEVIDSVEISFIKLVTQVTGAIVCCFTVIPSNDGEEQLSDYTDNVLSAKIVNRATLLSRAIKFDEEALASIDKLLIDLNDIDCIISEFKDRILNYEINNSCFVEIYRTDVSDKKFRVEIKKKY